VENTVKKENVVMKISLVKKSVERHSIAGIINVRRFVMMDLVLIVSTLQKKCKIVAVEECQLWSWVLIIDNLVLTQFLSADFLAIKSCHVDTNVKRCVILMNAVLVT